LRGLALLFLQAVGSYMVVAGKIGLMRQYNFPLVADTLVVARSQETASCTRRCSKLAQADRKVAVRKIDCIALLKAARGDLVAVVGRMGHDLV